MADARRLRARRRRHLHLLLDRRLVHRRIPGRRLGLRPRRSRAQAASPRTRPCSASTAIRCRAAAAVRRRISVVDLRLQRRAHDGRLSRVAAPAALSRTTRSILVNDGSTDRTLEIAQRFPEVRIISQENRGLSAARNVGIEASNGEIVAFTDSDCVVDPDWLTYLAYTFVDGGFVAVGGPNLPPPEESRTAACVAASPGGPTHVLLERRGRRAHPGLQHGLSARTCCGRSAASTPSFAPPATTSTCAGVCRTRDTRSASARRPWSGTSAATRSAPIFPTADGLRRGRGAAVFQAPLPLQSARPVEVAGAHLRRPGARLCFCGAP